MTDYERHTPARQDDHDKDSGAQSALIAAQADLIASLMSRLDALERA